jgi:hypothetical protein
MNAMLKSKWPVLAAVLLLIPIYLMPVWWVSLTAPNYPKESFPDGVRIHFHMNGVFNGCCLVEKAEINQDEVLDCVHEMDTINHYVGMYPIAAGGPVEVFFSGFLVAMVAVMLLGWAVDDPKKRVWVLGGGFALVAVWMTIALYVPGGLNLQNSRYLEGRVISLGQDGDDEPAQTLSSGDEMIARLKAALADDTEEVEEKNLEGKAKAIATLKDSYGFSKSKIGVTEDWSGTGIQLLGWHYRSSLARWFNDPGVIGPLVSRMTALANGLFAVMLILMILLVALSRRAGSLFHRLLVLVPIGLPAYFVAIYAAWLHWYGHNMNDMGAFTLKAFMPTVFGQGKVAQFTTNSYPHMGYYLMLVFAGLLIWAYLQSGKNLPGKAKDGDV